LEEVGLRGIRNKLETNTPLIEATFSRLPSNHTENFLPGHGSDALSYSVEKEA